MQKKKKKKMKIQKFRLKSFGLGQFVFLFSQNIHSFWTYLIISSLFNTYSGYSQFTIRHTLLSLVGWHREKVTIHFINTYKSKFHIHFQIEKRHLIQQQNIYGLSKVCLYFCEQTTSKPNHNAAI